MKIKLSMKNFSFKYWIKWSKIFFINYFRFKCKSYYNEKKNILNVNLIYLLFEKWYNVYILEV